MAKALLNIKVDPALKGQAQQVAEALGLPLGTIINAYLRDLVREQRVVFAMSPMPNQKTAKLLQSLAHDVRSGANTDGPFTLEQAMAHLDSI